MTEPFTLDLHTYLRRLGYSSAPSSTLETLREQQTRHTAGASLSFGGLSRG